MVMQEGAPSLGGRPGSLDHVLRDTGLSDFKAEFEQLAMDTGGAPQWIVNAQPPDQRAQVRVDLRSASKGAGFPPPISPEAGSVPAHKGLRPDDREGLEDRWNHRYSMTKNKRSPFVSWTRPLTLRCSTISRCRSATFSASSRLFDLNAEANRVRKNQSSAISASDV